MDELREKASSTSADFDRIDKELKSAEQRLIEIAALKKNIINYAKTREVYVQYRKAGWSKKRACTRSTGSLEKKCGSIRRHSTIRRCSLIWIETVRLITI